METRPILAFARFAGGVGHYLNVEDQGVPRNLRRYRLSPLPVCKFALGHCYEYNRSDTEHV